MTRPPGTITAAAFRAEHAGHAVARFDAPVTESLGLFRQPGPPSVLWCRRCGLYLRATPEALDGETALEVHGVG